MDAARLARGERRKYAFREWEISEGMRVNVGYGLMVKEVAAGQSRTMVKLEIAGS